MNLNDQKLNTIKKAGAERKGQFKKPICSLSKSLKESKEHFIQDPVQNKKNREQLILNYTYLVKWVVSRLPAANIKGIDKEDLISYGTIGLIESVDRFDPTKNTNLKSFAILRIRGAIYDQLRSSDWLTRSSRKKVKEYTKAVAELEFNLGRIPSKEEICEKMSIPLEELRAIQKESQMGISSLDDKRDDGEDGIALVDTISSGQKSIVESLEDNELLNSLTKAIDRLPYREKTVVGLYHYKKLTFKEIAHVMDFSESRASQLHARAISLLKIDMNKLNK